MSSGKGWQRLETVCGLMWSAVGQWQSRHRRRLVKERLKEKHDITHVTSTERQRE